MRRWVRGVAAMLAGVVLGALGTTPAWAAGQIDTYTVEAVIAADGSVRVTATIGLGPNAPGSLTQTFATSQETTGDRDYLFTVSDIAVTGAGQPQIATAGDATSVTIPTQAATGPVTLAYTVRGAARSTADGQVAVTWDYLQGLSLPVGVFEASVGVDATAQFLSIDCLTGPRDDPVRACTYWSGGTHDQPTPLFHQEDAAAGQVVRASVVFAHGAIAADETIRDRWTLGRAFTPGPAQLGLAAGIVVLAGLGLWLAHRRFGRDPGESTPIRVAEFHPVGESRSEFRVLDGVRPGQVGTVLDEHVDPVDVTATLLDLAVRGHLRIHELPRASAHAPAEWTFERIGGPSDDLQPYEQTLLDAVAPLDGEPATVSALAGRVQPVVGLIRSQLYDTVVARGWFARRPDATRGVWDRVGWAVLAVAVLGTSALVWLTTFGLVGVAAIVAALAVLFVAQAMPARTQTGAGMLAGLRALAALLATQPTDEVRDVAQVSAIVPYTVVLGGTGRWLAALEKLCDNDIPDPQELGWYHAPETWRMSDLPASLANFVTTVQGKLFTR